MELNPYLAITKQNITEVLAQTGRINNSDKFAADGLETIVNGIASRNYFTVEDVTLDIREGLITKDTYILFIPDIPGPGPMAPVANPVVDTAENIINKYSNN